MRVYASQIHVAEEDVGLNASPGLTANARPHAFNWLATLEEPARPAASCAMVTERIQLMATASPVAYAGAQLQGATQTPLKQRPESLASECCFRTHRQELQVTSCGRSRLRPEKGLLGRLKARQHSLLPEIPFSFRSCAVLPAVAPLARLRLQNRIWTRSVP